MTDRTQRRERVKRYLTLLRSLVKERDWAPQGSEDLSWLLWNLNSELYSALIAEGKYPTLLRNVNVPAAGASTSNVPHPPFSFGQVVTTIAPFDKLAPGIVYRLAVLTDECADDRCQKWFEEFKAHPLVAKSTLNRKTIALIEFPQMDTLVKADPQAIATLLEELLLPEMYKIAIGAFDVIPERKTTDEQEIKDLIKAETKERTPSVAEFGTLTAKFIPELSRRRIENALKTLLAKYGQQSPFPLDGEFAPNYIPRGGQTISTEQIWNALHVFVVDCCKIGTEDAWETTEMALSIRKQRLTDSQAAELQQIVFNKRDDLELRRKLLRAAVIYSQQDSWLWGIGEALRQQDAFLLQSAIMQLRDKRNLEQEMMHCFVSLVSETNFQVIFPYMRLFTLGERYLVLLRASNFTSLGYENLNKRMVATLSKVTGDQAVFEAFEAAKSTTDKLKAAEVLTSVISKEPEAPNPLFHEARVTQAILLLDCLKQTLAGQLLAITKMQAQLRAGYPNSAGLIPPSLFEKKRQEKKTGAETDVAEAQLLGQDAAVKRIAATLVAKPASGEIQPLKAPSNDATLLPKVNTVAQLLQSFNKPTPVVAPPQVKLAPRNNKRVFQVIPPQISAATLISLRRVEEQLERTQEQLAEERAKVTTFDDVPQTIMYGSLGQQLWNRAELDEPGTVSTRMTNIYIKRYFDANPVVPKCTYVWFGVTDANYSRVGRVPGYSLTGEETEAESDEKLRGEAADEAFQRLVEIHDDDVKSIADAAEGLFTPSLLLPYINGKTMEIDVEDLTFHSCHLLDVNSGGRLIVPILKNRIVPQNSVPPLTEDEIAADLQALELSV